MLKVVAMISAQHSYS